MLAWKRGTDTGAAAVEMAIVLPLLLLLVFGIIDFGRMLNAQITVTQAAREGARWEALNQDSVEDRVVEAAPGLNPEPDAAVTSSCPATPAINDRAVVEASYAFEYITPFGAIAEMFGGSEPGVMVIRGTGVMRCGG